MIEMHHICKTFRVAQRNAGFGEAVRALFRKDYTLVHALQDVSFTIGDGEIVGYIGPNGAGKSSTIKVMSGILTPDSGQCVIDGLVPWKSRKEHVSRIGVVFGQRSQLWWDVPVIDSFELIRDIYRVEPEAYRRQLDELTENTELEATDRYKYQAQMQKNILAVDKQLQTKRRMMLDIEKECAMTISAAMRSIPKTTAEPKNPLMGILNDDDP